MSEIYNWKERIDKEELEKVVQTLNNNGVIIFPTETVYGIGGKATSRSVIDRVYNSKRRPRDKAVNILVSNINEIEKYAVISSDIERKIINNFMPGPITIILNKRADFGDDFTADNNTIGVRIPNNKIVNLILSNIDFPLIAPSANISGKPSGIKAKDIIRDFENSVDIIIDGGDVKEGLSSTIVRVDGSDIQILRQGKITLEEIKSKIK